MFNRAYQLFTQRAAGLDGKVVFASSRGAVDDADVSLNSTTFGTNNTAVLQSILDEAASKPRKLVIDGRYSVTGLDVRGNTEISQLPGCGLILRNGSNRSLIRNRNRSKTTVTDRNIVIQGGILNGNAAGQTGRWSGATETNDIDLWSCVSLMGVQHVRISGVTAYKSPSYGFHLGLASNVWMEDCYYGANQEFGMSIYNGIQLQGGCSSVFIRDWWINCQDDAIALTADDGFEGAWFQHGPITDVVVENITLVNALRFLRLLSQTELLDRITVRGVKGTIFDCVLIAGNFPEEGGSVGAGNIGHVTLEDVRLDLGAPLSVNYKRAHCYIDGAMKSLVIKNWIRTGWPDAAPGVLVTTGGVVDHLGIDGMRADDTGGIGGPQVKVEGGSVTDLRLSGVSLKRSGSAIDAPLVSITSGTVGEVNLSKINADKIYHLVNQTGGTLNRVRIDNALHTNGRSAVKTAGAQAEISLSNVTTPLELWEPPLAITNRYRSTDATVLHRSNFATTANGTKLSAYNPLAGNKWTAVDGDFEMGASGSADGGMYIDGSNGSSRYAAYTDVGQSDYLRIVAMLTPGTGFRLWLAADAPMTNGLRADLQASGSACGIIDVTAGVATALVISTFTPSGTTFNLVVFEIRGVTATLTINNGTPVTATIVRKAGTKAGVSVDGGGAGTPLTNFRVDRLPQ